MQNADKHSAGLLLNEGESAALGSYAQWTPRVAVTVAHNPAEHVIFSLSCADVRFIAREGDPLLWADPAQDDHVIAHGYVPVPGGALPVTVSGSVLNAVVPVCEEISTNLFHRMFDGLVQHGMSGGPVIRVDDSRSVGIVQGRHRDLGHSAFVSYDFLCAVWNHARTLGVIPPFFLAESEAHNKRRA